MNAGRTIGYIVAVVMILIGLSVACIGIFYLWGSSASGDSSRWITIGSISAFFGALILLGGVGLMFAANRGKLGGNTQNLTLKVDLPANVNLDTIKCKSCGGSLTMDNIKMIAGAPVVNCPYCQTTYQLTEDPKW
jgi:hypothetical protein